MTQRLARRLTQGTIFSACPVHLSVKQPCVSHSEIHYTTDFAYWYKLINSEGDLSFQAPRRQWIQTASKAGVKTFGYLFTQPQPSNAPVNGGRKVPPSKIVRLTITLMTVSHGSEVFFVYGAPPDSSADALRLSSLMIDYWVSFATSLDPNDGKGLQRKFILPFCWGYLVIVTKVRTGRSTRRKTRFVTPPHIDTVEG